MGVLTTARLQLRPSTEQDGGPFLTLLRDPAVQRWWPDYDARRIARELLNAPGAART